MPSSTLRIHHLLTGAAIALAGSWLLAASPLLAANGEALVSYRADASTVAPDPLKREGGRWRPARKPEAPFRHGTEEINGRNYNYLTPNPINGRADDPDSFGSYQFLLLPEWVNDSAGWTATAVARVVSATSLNLHTCSFRIFDHEVEYMLSLFNDPARNQQGIVLRRNGMDLANKGGYGDALIPFNVSGDYHTYQLYYNPGEEKLTLYADGKELASLHRSELVRNAEITPRIRWGKETAHSSEVRWNEVRFELGKAIVPEKN